MSFEQLKKDIVYHSTDMGELGFWIRLEYAHELVERHEKRVREVIDKYEKEWQHSDLSSDFNFYGLKKDLGLEKEE